MATDYTQLTSITREKVMPKVVDEITKESQTLDKLFQGSETKDGGLYITIPVKYRINGQGGSYSGLEPLSAEGEQTRTRARFDWKQYYKPIVLSNIDIAKNGGEGKIVDLMSQEMKETRTDLADMFATAIWGSYTGGTVTGNGGKDIDSIIGATDDGGAVTTYGGIDRSTHTWFDGNEVAAGGAISLSKMREAFSRASYGSDQPNWIVTTPNGRDSYEGLLTATTQYITNVGSRGTNLEGSVPGATFRGVEIVGDRYAPSAKLYMLNTKHIYFVNMKHPDFPTDSKGFAMSDLVRPTSQDGKVGYIFWYGNLICEEPRKQSFLSGLTGADQY